jgi:hypothetical protein
MPDPTTAVDGAPRAPRRVIRRCQWRKVRSSGPTSAESLTTALSDGAVRAYRATLRSFLRYPGTQHHEICSLEQLRRDPHILGWLTAELEARSRLPI